jgi:hypothetical protein
MPARNAIARLPRELLASGQACEAGGRLVALKKGNSYTIKLSTQMWHKEENDQMDKYR